MRARFREIRNSRRVYWVEVSRSSLNNNEGFNKSVTLWCSSILFLFLLHLCIFNFTLTTMLLNLLVCLLKPSLLFFCLLTRATEWTFESENRLCHHQMEQPGYFCSYHATYCIAIVVSLAFEIAMACSGRNSPAHTLMPYRPSKWSS